MSGTDSLEEAVSLLQHHDGITGTAKKHGRTSHSFLRDTCTAPSEPLLCSVVNDYNRRIAAGWAEARQTVKSAIASLVRCGERPLHSVRRVSSSSRALRLASDRLRADDGTALPGRNTSGLGIEILVSCLSRGFPPTTSPPACPPHCKRIELLLLSSPECQPLPIQHGNANTEAHN